MSPDKKFEIVLESRDDDSYMYSDSNYSWYVASTQTGDQILAFYGHEYYGRGSTDKAGADHVAFSVEGDAVVVTNYDGTTELYPLPSDVTIVAGGKAIDVTWRDGRVERRYRRPCLGTTKYGQPYSVKDLIKLPTPAPTPASAPAPAPKAQARGKRKK